MLKFFEAAFWKNLAKPVSDSYCDNEAHCRSDRDIGLCGDCGKILTIHTVLKQMDREIRELRKS